MIVIDDESEMSKLLATYFERLGYETFLAINSRAGLELAKKLQPDVILLETKMPGLHGLELCRLIKSDELTKDAVVIFLTGWGMEDREKAFEAGASDFIGKPFAPRKLAERIHSCLAHRRLLLGDKVPAPPDSDLWEEAERRSGETALPLTLQEWAGVSKLNLCIIFTDIIGSTGLAAHYGDDAWIEILVQHFEQARNLLAEYDAWEIKLIGDAYMAAFRTADAALKFAEEFVKDPGHQHIGIRAAIHVGHVRVKDNDVYGLMVNKTQRLLSAAGDSQAIIVSSQAYSEIVSSAGTSARNLFTSSSANLRSFGTEDVWHYSKKDFADYISMRLRMVTGRLIEEDFDP